MEQLEQTKNKIEDLLDWVSNIGKEKEMGGLLKDQTKENGNLPVKGKEKGFAEMEDDSNGNTVDTTDNSPEWSGECEERKELDINQQYERVKVSMGCTQ